MARGDTFGRESADDDFTGGVAHGFQTMENDTEMLYLHTEFFSPAHDSGIRYDDPRIGIDWPLPVAQLSDKDTNYPLMTEDFKGLQI